MSNCTKSSCQVEAEVKRLEEKIKKLKDAIKTSKEQQASAKAECTKLEQDMKEFKDNKEGKTEELKVRIYLSSSLAGVIIDPNSFQQTEINKLKSALQKKNVQLKTMQKDETGEKIEFGPPFLVVVPEFVLMPFKQSKPRET